MPRCIPMSVDLVSHPKTRLLADLLGTSVPAAIGHLVGLWSRALDRAPDGDVTDVPPADLATWAMWPAADAPALLDALCDCRLRPDGAGFLERRNGRLLLHEWDTREGGVVVAQRDTPLRQRHPTRDAPTQETPVQNSLALFPDAPPPAPFTITDKPTRRPKGEAPNKAKTLIDTLRAAGVDLAMTAPDFRALKETSLTPEQVAEVFLAIRCDAWGGDFERKSLTVRFAIDRWNAYQASKQPHTSSRNGTNGKAGPAMAGYLWARAGDAQEASA
jgi:hypothetical protein